MRAVSSDAASKAASLLWVLSTNSSNHPRLVQVLNRSVHASQRVLWPTPLQGGCAAVLSKLLQGPADVASKVT